MLLKFLEIGQIVGTHGIHGEMRVQPWCDSPDFFKGFKTLYYDKDGQKAVQVLSARSHGNVVLLTLSGVDSVESAAAMRGRILFIKRDDAKIAKGSWFVQELIGCKVSDADSGRVYGVLSDVSQTGANDVWHIKNGDREYLVPAIPDVVVSADVENNVIEIRPMRGIFEDED